MRLEMGLDTRLALQQKLVLSPQILQSIEILQMTNTNLLELIEAELQENPALECDVPEETPAVLPPAPAVNGEAPAVPKTEEDEARLATQADAAPTSTYEPEEWDEFRTRRSD